MREIAVPTSPSQRMTQPGGSGEPSLVTIILTPTANVRSAAHASSSKWRRCYFRSACSPVYERSNVEVFFARRRVAARKQGRPCQAEAPSVVPPVAIWCRDHRAHIAPGPAQFRLSTLNTEARRLRSVDRVSTFSHTGRSTATGCRQPRSRGRSQILDMDQVSRRRRIRISVTVITGHRLKWHRQYCVGVARPTSHFPAIGSPAVGVFPHRACRKRR